MSPKDKKTVPTVTIKRKADRPRLRRSSETLSTNLDSTTRIRDRQQRKLRTANTVLRRENIRLKSEHKILKEKISSLESIVNDIQKGNFDKSLNKLGNEISLVNKDVEKLISTFKSANNWAIDYINKKVNLNSKEIS